MSKTAPDEAQVWALRRAAVDSGAELIDQLKVLTPFEKKLARAVAERLYAQTIGWHERLSRIGRRKGRKVDSILATEAAIAALLERYRYLRQTPVE